jgi:hypothetical protein
VIEANGHKQLPLGSPEEALLALNQGAMGRRRFPRSGIVDPSITTDHRSSPVLAANIALIRELIVCNGSVRPECRHLNVTDIAALPLVSLVLEIFDELRFVLPLAPAMSGDEAISQVLLGPGHVVFHLRVCSFLLQLLDLVGDVSASLGINSSGKGDTAEHGNDCRFLRKRSVFLSESDH